MLDNGHIFHDLWAVSFGTVEGTKVGVGPAVAVTLDKGILMVK